MDLNKREQSVAELRADKKNLTWGVGICLVVILLLVVKLVTQSEIIIQQTPGMPNNTVIERTAMDKGGQHAILSALTAAMVQVNPANSEYVKPLIQVWLAPAAYTHVSVEIDSKVQRLIQQHELGSYYWVEKGYQYDPVLNRHFVIGDVHTVNAAKDTAVSWVYEYAAHVENYRLVVDDPKSYPGDRAHDSEWLKANKQ